MNYGFKATIYDSQFKIQDFDIIALCVINEVTFIIYF